MARARESWKKSREEDAVETPCSTILLGSSSDDEEANGDLSAWIVERSKKREEERSAARRTIDFIEIDSSDDLEITSVTRGKKKKKKLKKKCRGAGGDHETIQIMKTEEESVLSQSAVSEKNEEIPNNIVFRKLLRGPRYFEPGSAQLETCYNCGEEGHIAALCTAEKRKKPCFVCGMFGHNSYKCNQGQDCYICKRRGHLAKECPEKRKTDQQQDMRVCIRCGERGHDMPSCRNDYPIEDLTKIQCYVCKELGHFCCSMFIDTSPGKISCYNCGDYGHSGAGCAKLNGEMTNDSMTKSCYICGEEGHFARGCSKRSSSSSSKHDRQKRGESFTSTPKATERGRGSTTSHSKRKEHSNGFKRKTHSAENRRLEIHAHRGGWIVDDDHESFDWRPRSKPWYSPYTPRTPPSRQSFQHYYNRYY